jgi:hypothetical protein
MSCLFNSFEALIGEDSYKIRQKICDYLQENNPILDGLQTSSILEFECSKSSEYIAKMRLKSTWGGAIEIQTACNIWSLRINVSNHRDQNKTVIEFIPFKGIYDKTIGIYWTGSHYEPIKSGI